MPSILLLHLGLTFYFGAVVLLFSAIRRGSRRLLGAGVCLSLVAGGAHAAVLFIRGGIPPTTLFDFALLLASSVMFLGVAADLVRGTRVLSVGCAPTALSFALVATLVGADGGPRPEKVLTPWATAHVLIMLVAFGALSLAFVGGMLFLFEQRKLKVRPTETVLGLLPPLETMYRMTIAGTAAGAALLTVGLIVGYLYARTIETASNAWRTDPKVFLTTATWLAYVLVTVGSFVPLLRGKRTAWASVVSFALVLLAFWASAFWSPFHRYR